MLVTKIYGNGKDIIILYLCMLWLLFILFTIGTCVEDAAVAQTEIHVQQ